jgi:hypothetical membrane protein
LFGAILAGIATVVTAIAYRGSEGQTYWPLNHWVSELGQLGVSELAQVFNVGLMVIGVCFAIFMAGLAWERGGALAWIYGPLGVAAGIAGTFVGVFPMNFLDQHGIAALTFFNLGWVCVALASIDFWRRPEGRFPRWLAWIGAFTVASFIGFLIVLFPLLSGDGLAAPENRPTFWIVPTLEWALITGILAWTFATSWTWLRGVRTSLPGAAAAP